MRLPFGFRNRKITLELAESVPTQDDRYGSYAFGVTVKRPNDTRGDLVNHVTVGGRFDTVTEWMNQDVREAESSQEARHAEAEVLYPVPDAV